ncbi:aminotransferase class I/II-fold pyridoxal phosphate-dependent enzyme [Nocardia wallacei]|uniref:aminotransferase class I/II-fold pyridoxal phosphate-dependent enzyme n=1 Tax=Nocardia wallacei TaxID=480035 RepID=UPI002453BAD0|nr:aminotransferase class I/II-fold pyridoxal phosphate-dependent enzyme [Nocardia wallacei]
MIPYDEVFGDPELPTRFTDARLVSEYRGAGSPAGELLYVGFGETWTRIAPGLTAALAAVPAHAHGYIVSQYGLPRLQRVLRDYVTRDHGLAPEFRAGHDYEVAATAGGTRTAMFDFGRMLHAEGVARACAPMPGWDYAGVFAPLGYRMDYYPASDGHPVTETLELDSDTLVVINAQHNPTGSNWPPDSVRRLLLAARAAGAAILLDDAYFGVHDPRQSPTSALRLLLETAAPARWLAVRSLGKQFHCSGWGIGAATASPDTLDALVNDWQFHHGFASAIPLQEAMARWLEDPAAERYLAAQGRDYGMKRVVLQHFLHRQLGYPRGSVQVGQFAPFARVPVPRARRHASMTEFRREFLWHTGVLVGVDRWDAHDDDEWPCYRLYLGPHLTVLREALGRIRKAGYGY